MKKLLLLLSFFLLKPAYCENIVDCNKAVFLNLSDTKAYLDRAIAK
ncbi:MAG: hypothetical protein WCK67_10630 [bacterium]